MRTKYLIEENKELGELLTRKLEEAGHILKNARLTHLREKHLTRRKVLTEKRDALEQAQAACKKAEDIDESSAFIFLGRLNKAQASIEEAKAAVEAARQKLFGTMQKARSEEEAIAERIRAVSPNDYELLAKNFTAVKIKPLTVVNHPVDEEEHKASEN